MRTITRWMPGLLVVSLAAAACADSTGVNNGLTADESSDLAGVMANDAFAESSTMALASVSTTTGEIAPAAVITVTFHDTVSCALGGDVAIDGTRVRNWDRTTQTGTMDMDMTRTQEACVRSVRNRQITVDGNPNLHVVVHHNRVDGAWSGLQTMTMQGGFTWTAADGASGDCSVDLSASYDPDTHTRTLTGTFCNRTINHTTTWSNG
jgi:hypothetical protein